MLFFVLDMSDVFTKLPSQELFFVLDMSECLYQTTFSSVIFCSSYVEMFLPNNLFKCYSLFLKCQSVFTKLPFQELFFVLSMSKCLYHITFSSVILCSWYVRILLFYHITFSSVILCSWYVWIVLPHYLFKCYSLFLICQNCFTTLPFQV